MGISKIKNLFCSVKEKACYLVLFLLACGNEIVAAEGVALPDSSANINKRVTELENFMEKHKKFMSYLPKITGYMQIGYTYDSEVSNFNIKSARIDANGVFARNFDYRLFVDFVNPKILDARVRWKPMKELNFCVGQFKVPFSLGNMLSPLDEECVSFPLVLMKLVGFSDVCGVKATGRDIGLSAYGSLFKMSNGNYLVDYAAGVFNGNGMNLNDDNKSKDISGRVILHPMKNLVLSGSYYRGEYGANYLARTRFSFGGSYNFGVATLRGEYISGVTGEKHSDGYYITAYGKFMPKISPVFRFDAFTEDKDIAEHQYNYTIGVDYHPFKFLRLQANYVRETFTALPSDNMCQIMLTGIF